MNSFVVIAFIACLATVNASWFHGPSAHVLQGPSSKTILVGPEGSVISAVAPRGEIVHEEHPGYVAHATPVHSHIVAHATPIVSHHAEAHVSPVVAKSTVVAHSPAYDHDNVAGPSGTISTGHSAHAPVVAHQVSVVAHGSPVVTHHGPVLAHFAPIVGYGVHGHEGEYVHDHSESLYDDGSYKPHLYHH